MNCRSAVRRRIALAMSAMLVLGGTPVPAQTLPAATDRTSGQASGPRGVAVTLVTGDRVRLRATVGGPAEADISPALRPGGFVPQFHVSVRDGDTHVVPSDMRPLVPDVLDPALFNVSLIAEQRLDDTTSSTLPLIATRSGSGPRRTGALPAGQRTTELSSIDALATEIAKSRIGELAAALSQRAGTRSRATATGPLAGIEKIWLDRRVEAQLDRSTRQISARAAWDAGFDGSGVTIAVLDTGVDDTHADLSGQVVAAQDFTGEQNPVDQHGHGTHVASIVAGTGAASGGTYRGVAPGADVVNGKVLDSTGNGLSSWVIEGMEWAAARAKVVSMSLGITPGNDDATLIRQAVDRISAERGTLFVVAAGNEGCDRCILSPGDAASALTVGAVDRQDRLADFSSRGPVHDTHALKPDVTAPGVGIVAARAKDAGLGGEGDYLALSGTSMATPHVAGAVALLLQARPGLTGPELKGALMSTAVPNDELSAYEQGAGRVDVRKVLDAAVLAGTGSVDYGYFPFPQAGLDPVRKTVSYRNVSTQPVTLRLRADVRDQDGRQTGAIRVDPAEVLVPPGGSATAEVVLDIAHSGPGRFLGRLIAEAPGVPALVTPVSFVADEEYFELQVTGVTRDGRPSHAIVSSVVDVEDGTPHLHQDCSEEPGPFVQCFVVPAGTYAVLGMVSTWPSRRDPIFDTPLHTALVGDPELTVTNDVRVVLDARKAVEVDVRTPDHDAAKNPGGAVQIAWTRTPARGQPVSDMVLNYPGAQLEERLFVQPMGAVRTGGFAMTTRWRLEAPDITMTARSRHGRIQLSARYHPKAWFSDVSSEYPQLDGRSDLRVVDAGEGRAADVAGARLSGALALVRRTDDVPVAEQANRAAAAGAAMVAVYNDRPGVDPRPGTIGTRLRVPTVYLPQADGLRLLDALDDRPVTVSAHGTVASPYLYDLVYAERGRVPSTLRYTARTNDLVRVQRDFHSHETAPATYSEQSSARHPWDQTVFGFGYPVRGTPRSRTDYHVWSPDVSWRYAVTIPEFPYGISPTPVPAYVDLSSPWTTYARGERRHEQWAGQPLRPGLNPGFPAVRAGDRLVLMPGFGAPDDLQAVGLLDGGNHFAPVHTSEAADISTRFRVWHGDSVLTDTDGRPGGQEGIVALPTAERDTYRMRFEVANNAPWARLSTRSSTDWTFASAGADPAQPEVQPLLTLRYDLDVDLRNVLTRSRQHGRTTIGVTVGHQPGSPSSRIAGLSFSASYDDGGSWRQFPATRLGDGEYRVDLGSRPPSFGRYVSFRVEAVDAAGNKVTQEVIRAAALPRPDHADDSATHEQMRWNGER